MIPKWPAGVTYVDLFAGPGICVDRLSGERFPGSPLIAANAPKPFSKILLCELDLEMAEACEVRMRASVAANRYILFRGDCNEKIGQLVDEIPSSSLVLAFLDPTGLHVHLETVIKLAAHGPVDLLILFPDAIDVIRNADAYYFDQPDSNLDKVLGVDSNWRERKASMLSPDAASIRRLFTKIYQDQLSTKAGYNDFGELVINGDKGPLYRLIYATKHSRGLDFWDKSVRKEFGGQGRLQF